MRTALVVVLLASAAAQQRPQVPGAIRSTVDYAAGRLGSAVAEIR